MGSALHHLQGSFRKRYPGPIGVAVVLFALEVITYNQRYLTDSLDGVPLTLAVVLHAMRAAVLATVIVRPAYISHQGGVIFTILVTQILLMASFADNQDTTLYLVAVISGMSVLFATFTSMRQSVVIAAVSAICVGIVVYPEGLAPALAISQSAFAGAVFGASPAAVAWFRHGWSQAQQRAESLAETDVLTGLLNRRGLVARIPAMVAEAERKGGQLVAVAMDLDHFKAINDAHGHAVGDQVLVDTAAALKSSFRRYDVLGRSGGEEFVALLLTTAGNAASIAERARLAVPKRTAPHDVTISIGVAAASPPRTRTVDPVDWALGLLEEADRLLYQAKESGRNLVLAGWDD